MRVPAAGLALVIVVPAAVGQPLAPLASDAVTLGFATDAEPEAKVTQMERALCDSKACQSLWLDAFPMRPTNGIRTTQEKVDEEVAACFLLINATCADCAKEHSLEDVCPHVLFHAQPQPISRNFAFCSGQVLTEGSSMSTVAWMRFIAWRNNHCVGSLQRSAEPVRSDHGVPLPEGGWLAYYETLEAGAPWGALGWTQSTRYK